MNLAPSMGAASAFASGGDAAGGLAWASAPEIISALSAADIISVLSIVASKRLRSVKESDGSLALDNQLASTAHVPPTWNSSLHVRRRCAVQKAVACASRPQRS